MVDDGRCGIYFRSESTHYWITLTSASQPENEKELTFGNKSVLDSSVQVTS